MWLCGPGPPLLPSGLKASGVVGDYLAWGHCEGHLGSVSSEVLCWVGVGWEDPSSLKFALQNLSSPISPPLPLTKPLIRVGMFLFLVFKAIKSPPVSVNRNCGPAVPTPTPEQVRAVNTTKKASGTTAQSSSSESEDEDMIPATQPSTQGECCCSGHCLTRTGSLPLMPSPLRPEGTNQVS